MKKILFTLALICSYAAFAITERAQLTTATTAQIQQTGTTTGGKGTPIVAYKNGTYTGISADAIYGNIQVQVTIANGAIADIQFLDYPKDRAHSIQLSTMAMPLLKARAIKIQAANVDTVSGASETSQAFRNSLQSALDQAKA